MKWETMQELYFGFIIKKCCAFFIILEAALDLEQIMAV